MAKYKLNDEIIVTDTRYGHCMSVGRKGIIVKIEDSNNESRVIYYVKDNRKNIIWTMSSEEFRGVGEWLEE